MSRLTVIALALVVVATASRASAQTTLDFVTFDGIHYIRWHDEAGRSLQPSDLGIEFATVECALYDDRQGCPFGRDAAAAYIPAGTRVYAVRGYRTNFRLAAVVNDRIFLYQAWRSATAKVGGDLYDIAGKVRAIDVRPGSAARSPPSVEPARVTAPADRDALVEMIVRGEMRAPRPHAFAEPRYWVTLWLADGTTLDRPYFVETSELLGGLILPGEFRQVLEQYLRE